jgi:hypothetical protein
MLLMPHLAGSLDAAYYHRIAVSFKFADAKSRRSGTLTDSREGTVRIDIQPLVSSDIHAFLSTA